ncbi:MAG: FUSC family protein [Alphaproteobacteria bacterium]|nr:FUSC family protein [Alphaproteobacteria bacterium]
MPKSIPRIQTVLTIPRRMGAGLFRIHIENGVFVSLGMALVGLGMAVAFGSKIATLAAAGALCTSVVDQPGQLKIKAWMFALTTTGTTLLTILTIIANGAPLPMATIVAGMSFVSALITAYGRRAIGLGVAATLALLFGMVETVAPVAARWHVVAFAAGALEYSLFALAASMLLDNRNRRMFVGEAIRAFGRYVLAKSALYDARERPRPVLQALIGAHADFIEQLQAARNMIFVGRRTPNRVRWIAILVALLDCFDTIVASDADIEILRKSGHNHLMGRFKVLIAGLGVEIEELALALMTPGMSYAPSSHAAEIQAIEKNVERLSAKASDDVEPMAISAFRSTGHKLAQTVVRLEQLSGAVNARPGENMLPNVEFEAFVHRDRMDPRVLVAHFSLASPTMRYAIRATVAMVCGYLITLALPTFVHGGWVLLTTSLTMRASYSITKQRRNDRIIGTVAGCAAAFLLVYLLPREWLFVPIIITVGSAHAFGTVDYRVTALSASITALLTLHFFAPSGTQVFFAQRLADTLIGASLAWLFSHLLPSWEWRNIPKLIDAKLRADHDYAALALKRYRNDHDFRLARKHAHDAMANLSMTVRRVSDEPRIDRRMLVTLNDLIAANYLFASDLASMQVLFRMRKGELDFRAADALLEAAQANVTLSLSSRKAYASIGRLSRRSLGHNLGGHDAMVSLRRRLVHIEHNTKRVATLAARVSQMLQTAVPSA